MREGASAKTLQACSDIALWTGEAGDAAEALRLFRELLPDVERALGPDHVSTFHTRNEIAVWTGDAGDAEEALRLLRELLPDLELTVGRGHQFKLITRNISRYGPGGAATPAKRGAFSKNSSLIRSAYWGTIIRTRSDPATTWGA